MANGRPGDGPLTDILIHGHSSYPDDVVERVRELADMPGFASVQLRVDELLSEQWPTPGRSTRPDLAKVRDGLAKIARLLAARDDATA